MALDRNHVPHVEEINMHEVLWGSFVAGRNGGSPICLHPSDKGGPVVLDRRHLQPLELVGSARDAFVYHGSFKDRGYQFEIVGETRNGSLRFCRILKKWSEIAEKELVPLLVGAEWKAEGCFKHPEARVVTPYGDLEAEYSAYSNRHRKSSFLFLKLFYQQDQGYFIRSHIDYSLTDALIPRSIVTVVQRSAGAMPDLGAMFARRRELGGHRR